MTSSFSNLSLAEPLARAVAEMGYETMTPIQAKSIPIVLEGRDVMGAAQTGTGKTAAFSIPLLQKMLRHAGKRVEDFAVDRCNGFGHALAQIAQPVSIPELHRLMSARRGTRGHRCPSLRAIFEEHIDFDGRITPAVEDFTTGNVENCGHRTTFRDCRGLL